MIIIEIRARNSSLFPAAYCRFDLQAITFKWPVCIKSNTFCDGHRVAGDLMSTAEPLLSYQRFVRVTNEPGTTCDEIKASSVNIRV